MKKALLMAAAIVAAAPACAEWNFLFEGKDSSVSADTATLRVRGDIRRIWLMRDYRSARQVSGKSFLSTKVLYEFNCNEEQDRTLQIVAYKDHNGTGPTVISDDSPSAWSYNPPGSIGASTLEFVCALRVSN